MGESGRNRSHVGVASSVLGVLLYLHVAVFAAYLQLLGLATYGFSYSTGFEYVEDPESLIFLLFIFATLIFTQFIVLLFPFEKDIGAKLLVQFQMHGVGLTCFMMFAPLLLTDFTMPYLVVGAGAILVLVQIQLIFQRYGEQPWMKFVIHLSLHSSYLFVLLISAM